jgi:hypothetical protein
MPVIRTDDLEKNAEGIVAAFYPEALASPMPIDVHEFTRRMGLTVREARLSRSRTVFGRMVFGDCAVKHFDSDGKRRISTDAAKGTVFVDPEVHFLRTLGSLGHTVIHECVHWHRHRKAVELERLYDENARMIRCPATENAKDGRERNDSEWMEWHANALAPRIMMPLEPFREKPGPCSRN